MDEGNLFSRMLNTPVITEVTKLIMEVDGLKNTLAQNIKDRDDFYRKWMDAVTLLDRWRHSEYQLDETIMKDTCQFLEKS